MDKSIDTVNTTHKKEGNNAATWMQLEIIILGEMRQKRERQIPYDIIYMWDLKYGTNGHLQNRHTDMETRLTAARRR